VWRDGTRPLPPPRPPPRPPPLPAPRAAHALGFPPGARPPYFSKNARTTPAPASSCSRPPRPAWS
jgi:hypothetical protein